MSDDDYRNEDKLSNIDNWVEEKNYKKSTRRKVVYVYEWYNYSLMMQTIGIIFIWFSGLIYIPHNLIPCISAFVMALIFILFSYVSVTKKIYVEK